MGKHFMSGDDPKLAPYIGGFDPGKKGAFVTLDRETGKLVDICRVPLIKHVQNHRKPKKPTVSYEIDWPTLNSEWGHAIQLCSRIYIEHIWGAAPRGQNRRDGGPSQFKLGYAAGVPFGLILSWGTPYHFITPQAWHKLVDYPKTPEGEDPSKAPSFDLARKFFPDSVKEFARVTVDEGVAEASLIAYSGWRFVEAEYAAAS